MLQRTELGELGEFGLIETLTKPFVLEQESSVLGVGDDAALIDNGGSLTVVSTDLLIEGVHFDLMYVPLKHLGYKAVSVNVSDIYAMNARPQQITVAIAVSNRFSVEALKELYEGIRVACKHYRVDLVGGDTSTSVRGLTIAITAIGQVSADQVVRRSGARVGDLICVSGDLGGAYLGLQLLEREKQVYLATKGQAQPDLEQLAYVVGRQLKPEARHDIVQGLAACGIRPSAMMDLSDGLSSDLLHLCRASGTGAYIEEAQLPIHQETYQLAMRFQLDATTCALHGGEDYELLFTVAPEDAERLRNLADVSVIGRMVPAADGILLCSRGGNLYPITAQGWKHFGPDLS